LEYPPGVTWKVRFAALPTTKDRVLAPIVAPRNKKHIHVLFHVVVKRHNIFGAVWDVIFT
jgi:hypothetical protein